VTPGKFVAHPNGKYKSCTAYGLGWLLSLDFSLCCPSLVNNPHYHAHRERERERDRERMRVSERDHVAIKFFWMNPVVLLVTWSGNVERVPIT